VVLADIAEITGMISNLIITRGSRTTARVLDPKECEILGNGGRKTIRNNLVTEDLVTTGEEEKTELVCESRRVAIGGWFVKMSQVDQSLWHEGGSLFLGLPCYEIT
jgi:hypothetical protein